MSQCHSLNGSSVAGLTLTPTTPRMEDLVGRTSCVVSATGQVTTSIRLEDAAVAGTGPVWNTWCLRHAWMDMFLCAHSILNWSTRNAATFHGFNASGRRGHDYVVAWQCRPLEHFP
eukprot:3841492-Amphidinium_carterae.3